MRRGIGATLIVHVVQLLIAVLVCAVALGAAPVRADAPALALAAHAGVMVHGDGPGRRARIAATLMTEDAIAPLIACVWEQSVAGNARWQRTLYKRAIGGWQVRYIGALFDGRVSAYIDNTCGIAFA